jgi:hypothetical protein
VSIAPEMAGRAVKIRNAYQRCNCYSWNLKLMLIRWRKGEAGAEALAFMTLRSVLGLASYQPLASPSGNPRMMSRLTGDGNDFAPAERRGRRFRARLIPTGAASAHYSVAGQTRSMSAEASRKPSISCGLPAAIYLL